MFVSVTYFANSSTSIKHVSQMRSFSTLLHFYRYNFQYHTDWIKKIHLHNKYLLIETDTIWQGAVYQALWSFRSPLKCEHQGAKGLGQSIPLPQTAELPPGPAPLPKVVPLVKFVLPKIFSRTKEKIKSKVFHNTVQCTPLFGITLGQQKSYSSTQMVTTLTRDFCLLMYNYYLKDRELQR